MHTQSLALQRAQPDDRPTERVTALIPSWLYQHIERDARRRMISLSAVVREQLADHYRRQEPVGQERP